MSKKFKCPPQYASGSQTPFDNLVGFQLVDGGGFTQGNFEFTSSLSEKVDREFNIGSFSGPISLENLNLDSIIESKILFTKNYGVYPNIDLSDVTNFTLYGSLVKRLESSVKKIINYFPAAIEMLTVNPQYVTGTTAYNIFYNTVADETEFEVNIDSIRNSFLIDFTTNSTRNISAREIDVSFLRNLTVEYEKYSLFYNETEYPVIGFTPSNSLTNGVLKFIVTGNPFSGSNVSITDYYIKPNTYYTELSFNQFFDEVEKFLLNRNITPEYTASFNVQKQSDSGEFYINNVSLTWPKRYIWNLDVESGAFQLYLESLSEIGKDFDLFTTNLISRFLVTDAIKEFDTEDRKIEKVLQIYGRSFDEVKKFIDGLAYINSVNYDIKDDIPSQLLKNLSSTLGWNVNISPISEEEFLSSIFSLGGNSQYSGLSINKTPDELNYQFYRNLILNSAHLFKSKGTRRSIEFLLRMIGAPDALIEFNEYIYIADQKVRLDSFNDNYANISAGTYTQINPQLVTDDIYSIYGISFTNFITSSTTESVNVNIGDYPIDEEGYPKPPKNTNNFFFQQGAGWYQQTPQHRSPEEVNLTTSVFTGNNPSIQTQLTPFTYGEKYLDRFRYFPFMNEGFKLRRTIDNRKSWLFEKSGLRENFTGNYNAYYYLDNEKLVLNVKNIEVFLNPSQGLVYDVWKMSQNYDYPIPNTGLTTPYPVEGGIDWTVINPQPKKRAFFEFAQTFWVNMINVRNRMYITDGKTGGYPTLTSIFWKYIETNETTCIPFDDFTYQKLIDYVEQIGDYWISLIEQMVPATTIWNTGVKYENSIFNRQKFVYRRQRGCQIVPVPCRPCIAEDSLFDYDCSYGLYSCPVVALNRNNLPIPFTQILYQTLINYLNNEGIPVNNCIRNTLISQWYVNIKINNNTIINVPFYTGYGLNDVPTIVEWINALINNLTILNNYGYYGYVDGDKLFVRTLSCVYLITDNPLELNMGINLTISCNN
jgi:hypothetical protein